MLQLPGRPGDANTRALGQVYRESFTGLTTDTVALTYEPTATVDGVHLELVFKNGQLLDGAGGGAGFQVRERFTGISGTSLPLTNFPVVAGTELVFKNGQLLDDHPAQEVDVTPLVTELDTLTVTVGSVSVSVTASGTASPSGDSVDVSGSGTGSGSGTIDDGTAHGVGTLEVEPARGGYTIDGPTGEITLDNAADPADVFTVLYTYGVGADGTAGYEIDGATLTLATPLVETDVLIVQYPYRN